MSGASGYEVTLQRSAVDVARLVPEWEAFLATDAAEHCFFQYPVLVQQALGDPRQPCEPCIVVARRGGRIRALAPFRLEATRFHLRFSVLRVGSLPMRALKLAGDRLIVARGEDVGACHAAIFAAIAASKIGFDLVALESVTVPGDLWDFFATPAGPFRLIPAAARMQKVRQLRLDGTFDDYLAAMNAKTRMKFRRRTRKFRKDFDEQVELRSVTRAEDVRPFLDAVDAIFPSTWQARVSGTRPRNGATDVASLEEIARRGWLRSYLLFCRARPVAFVLGYQYHGVYHHDETGYDQALSAHGPGTVLNQLLVEELFARDRPRLLDFGFGDNEYKRILGNVEHDACAAWLVADLRWRALIGLQRGINGVYDRVRSELVRRGLDARVRDLLKRRTRGTASPSETPEAEEAKE
ncbi:MAG: GNAT family N-acetyltransferase [Myxococcales bacterium]|nr:GNAT family N-acetyltransferase [Myxococcales bacterium]